MSEISRSKLAPGRDQSAKIMPVSKAGMVALSALRSMLELGADVKGGISDLQRYLVQVGEYDIGGEDWGKILGYLNLLSGMHNQFKSHSQKVKNAIEDIEQNYKGGESK